LDFYQMIKPGVWHNYEHKLHHDHTHNHDGHDHGKKEEKKHGSTYQAQPEDFQGKAMLTQHTGDTHKDSTHAGHSADSTKKDSAAHAAGDHATAHGNDHKNHADHDAHAEGDAHGHGKDTHGHGEKHGPGFMMGIHFPGLLELGTMLGFLGLFLFVTFSFLSKASLLPKNDPFLEESEHHHT
jgi:hypothetical protein